jgi:Ni/Co efflux regulator RcnB
MTGKRIAELMMDGDVKQMIARVARRRSRCIEDQEEYIADAWVRISEKCEDDSTIETIEHEAGRGIHNAFRRGRYVTMKDAAKRTYTGESLTETKVPKDALPLERNRYLLRKPEKMSSWYYVGEWLEYGLEKDSMTVRTIHQIIVKNAQKERE